MNASEDRHGPGVRIHPPIIFGTSILGGIGLNRPWPVEMPFGLHGSHLAVAILACGVLLAGFCLREFYRAQTDVRPDRPDSALITTGPYSCSRNPLYIVLALIQLAVAAWLNMGWIAAMIIVSVIVISRYAIVREEQYLEQLFGQAYRDYTARVRRWI